MGMRNDIDWELIEREYRLGQKSIRQMATEFGVQPSAISRKAKKQGWVQDKSAEVKLLSEAQLLVSNREATEKATPTQQDIQIAATTRTNAILSHRSVAVRLRNVGMAMLDELEHQTVERETYDKLGELMFSPDDKGVDKLNDAYKKAMSLPGRIASYKTLTDGFKTGIAIERQAFGIEDGQGTEDESRVIQRIERVIVDITPKQ